MANPPDRAAFEADLRMPLYRRGELAGHWALVSMAWPHAVLSVAASARPGPLDRYFLRFELSGYPATAPTAGLWDAAADAPLPAALWPTGNAVFASVFRPEWREGECLYLPCDRLSALGHDMWRHQHHGRLWNPGRGIAHFLEQVHALLTQGRDAGAPRA